ncbi:MAG: hypothetical protein ABIV43_00970 [Candidatus Saccharimonadales bacterium]
MKHLFTTRLQFRTIIVASLVLAADLAFFNLTNPQTAPSALLIVGCLLLSVTVYGAIRLTLAAATVYGLPLLDQGRREARLLGGLIGLMIALQTLGELTLRDVVVLTLLGSIGYLYTTYGRAARSAAPRG